MFAVQRFFLHKKDGWKMENWEIGDAYNLKLIRNTDRTDTVRFKEDENVFFMMDYFNFLKSVRLQKVYHGYKKLCGLKTEYSEGLAYQSIGIYRTWEKDHDKPFLSGDLFDVSETRPFIGLILVYILDYRISGSDGLAQGDGRIEDMGGHLESYRELLRANIKLDERDYAIFQTIAGADFCIAVRTNRLLEIYNTAKNIMNIGNPYGKRVFFTYTNVGIACGTGKNLQNSPDSLLKIDNNVVESNKDIELAIRFRMESSVLQEMRELQKKMPSVVEVVNGLFGRYDLVIRSSMAEFYEIYPYLYKNKVNALKDADSEENVLNSLNSKINRILLKSMCAGTIRTMNIRILVHISEVSGDDSESPKPWFDNRTQEKIRGEIQYIKEQYADFQDAYKSRFLMNNYWYQDICRIFERILNLYEGLAYEFDTYFNWRVYEDYLRVLFCSMNSYMEKMEADNQSEVRLFITEFQLFIRAFDEYIKILQGINQNTLQAPKYDSVAPFDGQKFLLSYTEYLTQIYEQYRTFPWEEWNKSRNDDKEKVCQDARRKMKVIIYPEILENRIVVKEVFHYPETVKQKSEEQPKDETGLLICMLPAFEYFARIYDMIPLITHEICHQMLILDRKVRNEFYISELFEEISKKMSYSLLREYSSKKHIIVYDDLTWVFQKKLAECLVRQYKKDHQEWADYAFSYINSTVEGFLKNYIRMKDENDVLNKNHIELRGLIQDFQNFIYEIDYNRGEHLIRLVDIQKCYEEQFRLAQKGHGGEANDAREKGEKELGMLYESLYRFISPPEGIERIDMEHLKMVSSNAEGWLWMDNYICDYYNEQSQKCDKTEKRQKLKYYVDNIRKLHVLYTNLVEYEWRDFTELDCLIREYAGELNKIICKSYINGERYASYSQDKFEKVTRLEILSVEKAYENLKHFFETYDFTNLGSVIERTSILYRESCADIMMCGFLGFTAFGYFRMSVTFWARMGHNDNQAITTDYLLRQRLIVVLMVLLTTQKKSLLSIYDDYYQYDITDLKDQIYEYTDNQLEYAETRIIEAIKRDYPDQQADQAKKEELIKNCKRFFGYFKQNIEVIKNDIKENKKVYWDDGIWDVLCQENHPMFENAEELRDYLRREMNLYTRVISILCMLAEIQVDGKISVKKDYLDHMKNIYAVFEKRNNIHQVVEKVVRFYNEPDSESKTNNEEKMKDMLLFMQDHYFYSRYKCIEESGK